ncbi:metallophosphoesterase family protein [Sphingobacterium bambusae]|uniref:Metallophosphoesterase family protein n=1 Tax=Sphingobacterium bambusae TaxID=662858 RepID=A0ABW6BLT7_9SPHI|nr:metallophosphoesterase [Sphingobacterium bambusae]WPL46715.1 metallophosphoesterase [Sphingobacterium bambusae]
MKKTPHIIILLLSILLGSSPAVKAQQFKFAFLTDLHIHSDSTLHQVAQRLQKLPKSIDFVLSGGDNVDIDNLKPADVPQGEKRLAQLKDLLDKTNKPYHMAIGNHDRLPSSLRHGKNDFQAFEKTFGNTYYSFTHKGCTFIVLNSVEVENNQYSVKSEQLNWLKDLLSKTPQEQPIVVVSHVPFLSVYYPVLEGRYTGADTFQNQKQVFDLFENHNLKLVLQGHMHLYEEIKVKGVQFITAGAVSGNWWHGVFHGTAPGHLEVELSKDNVKWEYIQ